MSIFLLVYILICNLNNVKCRPEVLSTATELTSGEDSESETEISLVELDIKTKNNTPEYSYSNENGQGIFVAKTNYGFNKTKISNTVVWQSDNDKDYAYKVVVDSSGSLSRSKNISIHLARGGIKHFEKSSQNQKWKQESTSEQPTTSVPETSTTVTSEQSKVELSEQNEITTEQHKKESTTVNKACKYTFERYLSDSDVKLYSQDQSDPNNLVELGTDKYVLDGSDEYILKYTLNDEAKCGEVKLKNHVIWKYGDNSCQDYPKALYFHRGKTVVFIEFPNDSFNFYRFSVKDNSMKLKTLSKLEDNFESKHKLSTLEDDESTKENDQSKYEVKKYTFGYEYKLNPDARCTCIKFNNKELWKYDPSDDQNDFPALVYFLSNFLVLFLRNNKCFFIDSSKLY